MASQKPLEFDDDELDEMAEVTDQDLLMINQYLIKVMSDRFKNLPLATEDIDDARFAEIG